MHSGVRVAAGLLALAVLVGCGPQRDRNDLESLRSKARDAAVQGRADDAIAMLDKALGERGYRPFQPELLQELTLALLVTGRVDEAEARVFSYMQRKPDMGYPSAHVISSFLEQQNRMADNAAWLERLMGVKLPDRILGEVAERRMHALRAVGRFDELMAVMEQITGRVPAPVLQRLAENQTMALIVAQRFEPMARFLGYLDRQATQSSDPAWKPLAARMRLMALAGEGKWPEAHQFFRDQCTRSADVDLAPMLNRLIGISLAGGQSGLATQTIERALVELKDRPQTRDVAGQWWIKIPLTAEACDLVVDRLGRLLSLGCSTGMVVQQANTAYGLVMQAGSTNNVRGFVAVCQSLLPLVKSDADVALVKGMILDASFRGELFDETLQVLQSGMPGQNAGWQEMMSNKVLAHRALKEGRVDEAVERFRRFMEYAAAQEEDQVDPVNGTRVTKEMILGLNARRIGDILRSAGRAAEAEKAYAEAVSSYEAALARFREDDREHRQILQVLNELRALTRAAR